MSNYFQVPHAPLHYTIKNIEAIFKCRVNVLGIDLRTCQVSYKFCIFWSRRRQLEVALIVVLTETVTGFLLVLLKKNL